MADAKGKATLRYLSSKISQAIMTMPVTCPFRNRRLLLNIRYMVSMPRDYAINFEEAALHREDEGIVCTNIYHRIYAKQL
jgi:hypothetical protein